MTTELKDKTDIVLSLYKTYYASNATPDSLVSSHWKKYHQLARISVHDNRVQSLKGEAFGVMENPTVYARIISQLMNTSYFLSLNNKNAIREISKSAKALCRKINFFYSYDCFRQVCALALFIQHIPKDKAVNILCIGDGYGFFSFLAKAVFPKARLYLVDLGKTLLFQAHYGQMAYPHLIHQLIDESTNPQNLNNLAELTYCPAEHLDKLNNCLFDVAVNISSMQEMNQDSVMNYFSFIRAHMPKENLFYCANRLEKIMPGGEVSRFFEYPWRSGDKHLIEEMCPWQKYVLSVHRSPRGPKVFNIRVPFVQYYDGDIYHRLTVLETAREP